MNNKRPTEAHRSARLFEAGLGYVALCRFKADGRCEVGFFLIDTFCFGVKDAGFKQFDDYDEMKEGLLNPLFRGEEIEAMSPEAARKLVEDAVAYAKNLGFPPAADYKKACRVFGGLSPAECTEEFVFGHEGKPFYVQGPSDSPARRKSILQTLERSCGPGGYEYMMVEDFAEDFDDEEDFAEEEPGESATRNEAGALQEMIERQQAEHPEVEIRLTPENRPKLSDRLGLVAEPLLDKTVDFRMRKRIILLAALAWNNSRSRAPDSEKDRAEISQLFAGKEGEDAYQLLVERAKKYFPDDERLILEVEMDPPQGGVNPLRVTSIHPDDQPGNRSGSSPK